MFWPREDWGESKKKRKRRDLSPSFFFCSSPNFGAAKTSPLATEKLAMQAMSAMVKGMLPGLGPPSFCFCQWIRPLNLLLHLTVLWMTRLLLPIVFLFDPLLPLILYYLFLLPLLPRHCVHCSCFCYCSCFCPRQVSSWYRDLCWSPCL